MYLIRFTEEMIVSRYHKYQEMRCPTHLSIGQEAPAACTMLALEENDHLYSSHRCHAHYIAKGGDLDSMIAELHGKATGCTGGWGGSMHLSDEDSGFMGASPVIGDSISLAVGSALAFKLDGSNRVAVACFGDTGVECGQFWEAANFASLHNLPIMFVSENNSYATSTPLSARQPAIPAYERVRPFMWSAQVDQHSIESMYELAKECREAQPGFLEITTYRHLEHVGPNTDWDQGYRSETEVQKQIENDPILLVKSHLSQDEIQLIEKEVSQKVTLAFQRALEAPWPEAKW